MQHGDAGQGDDSHPRPGVPDGTRVLLLRTVGSLKFVNKRRRGLRGADFQL